MFEVTSNGAFAGSTLNKQFELPINFGGQTRVSAECVVAAKRGDVSNSATISFQACKMTPPSAPSLRQFSSAVLENTVVFEWKASVTAGDDCKSKDIDSSVLYTLELVDGSGKVVASETSISGTSQELNVTGLSGSYKWKVTAYNKNTPTLSATSTGEVSVNECTERDPTPHENQQVSPADESLFVERDTAVVYIKWQAPTWGMLCTGQSVTQSMVFVVERQEDNGTWNTVSNQSISDPSSATFHEQVNIDQDGTYRWSADATITSTNDAGTATRTATIASATFDVCLFVLPTLELVCSDSLIVADPTTGTFEQAYTASGLVKACQQDTFELLVRGNAAGNDFEQSIANVTALGQLPPDVVTVRASTLGLERGNTTASIQLHGVLRGKTTTSINKCEGLKICMPFVPEAPDVVVQVDNETGQLRVNWAGSVMRVRDTGCHPRASQFTVVIQSTHGNANEQAELVLNTTTSDDAVTVNDQPSSDISASVKADNGFFESEWTQKQLRLDAAAACGTTASCSRWQTCRCQWSGAR